MTRGLISACFRCVLQLLAQPRRGLNVSCNAVEASSHEELAHQPGSIQFPEVVDSKDDASSQFHEFTVGRVGLADEQWASLHRPSSGNDASRCLVISETAATRGCHQEKWRQGSDYSVLCRPETKPYKVERIYSLRIVSNNHKTSPSLPSPAQQRVGTGSTTAARDWRISSVCSGHLMLLMRDTFLHYQQQHNNARAEDQQPLRVTGGYHHCARVI
ncbi:hypothetical protein J6590_005183 [Homalodisca vitripennis]|nr:hypothetical protein J6590_005183 [Homalodisca vitripennis]